VQLEPLDWRFPDFDLNASRPTVECSKTSEGGVNDSCAEPLYGLTPVSRVRKLQSGVSHVRDRVGDAFLCARDRCFADCGKAIVAMAQWILVVMSRLHYRRCEPNRLIATRERGM
jgi:hypothetical protein